METQHRSFLKTKGFLPYLVFSILIHGVLFVGLYLIKVLPNPEVLPNLVPVEIIRHGASPIFTRSQTQIQHRTPNRGDLKSKSLPLSFTETYQYTAAVPQPGGKSIQSDPILPTLHTEPIPRKVPRKPSVAEAIKSAVKIRLPQPHLPEVPVIPSPPDEILPLGVEASGTMVTATIELSQRERSKFSRISALAPKITAAIEPIYIAPMPPDSSGPNFAEERDLVLAKPDDFSLRLDRPTAAKSSPEITPQSKYWPQPIEEERESPPIIKPDTELAAFKFDSIPNFPLPGSPEGALFLLAIDTSGSVKGAPLKGIKKSAHDFVNLMGPNDLAGIITFDDRVRGGDNFIADKGTLHKKIEALKPTGSLTVLYDTLMVAYEMISRKVHKNRFIVLFSDGKDEGSQTGLENVLKFLHPSGIPILAVGYTRVETKYLRILDTMADKTGGIFVHTPQFRDMISLYRSSHPEEGISPGLVPPKQALLKINSRPANARVYLNGELRGKTPLDLKLPKGKYEILISKPTYYNWQAQVSLDEASKAIEIRLLPIK